MKNDKEMDKTDSMIEVPQHKHCMVCESVVLDFDPNDDKWFCSDECRKKYKTIGQKRTIIIVIIYLMMLIILIGLGYLPV